MKFKKLAAGITAVACCTGLLTMVPEMSDITYASEAVKNDFETDYEGWYANDDSAALTAVQGEGFGNSRGMKITGRTSADVGAASSKGFYLWGGKEYDYSIQVKADTAETFRLSLLYKDEETEEASTVELVKEKAKAGEWTELSASFEAPENTYEYLLTITTDSTSDFTFDDVVITTEEAGVSAAPAGKGLKDEFANYGFRVGNILNGGTVRNSAITAIMLKDHNAIECENETKPDATLVANGSTDTDIKVSLNSCAAIADFCVKNNLGFRGHTLVWHSQTPSWFFKSGFNQNGQWVNSSTMDQRLESYIKNMFKAFETQYPSLDLYAYDVCNECVSDDGSRTANNGGAREPGEGNGKSCWVQVYGNNSFIEKAFSYARKYAPPTCKLYYNDYNEYWDHKRDCILKTIVKPLYEKGLLDGMGMQSHVPANATGFAGTDVYLQAMDMYLSVGCDVQVTELDISVNNGEYSYTDQANKYKAIFQHAIDVNTGNKYNGKVTLVQVWGPNDGNSWLSAGSNALLYDANNNPKEAYKTVTAMIPDSEWGDGSNVGTVPATPPEPNEFGWWFCHSFENELCGWEKRGGTTIESSSREHYTEYGSNSLYISGREDSWNAAQYTLSPRVFQAGETYSFSAHAKYTSGNDTETFKFTMEYTGSDGETHWDEIATSAAVPDKWVQLANTEYKIPEGATGMKIYVETIDSTTSFYIDEVIGAVGGTVIPGEGSMDAPVIVKPGVTGDLNGDGIINVFDLCMAKRGVKNGFASTAVKNAADIDGSGNVDITDIEYIQKFIVKKITEFPVVERPTEPEPAAKRTISEYTPVVSKNVVEYDTFDSRNEKPGVQYGTLEQKSYFSTFCNREKKYNVLLPPGYTTSKKYPVMYVMHGYWENQDRMIIEGNGTMYTKQLVGNAIAEGAAEEMILVFPYIYSSQTQDDCNAMDDANNIAYDNFGTVLTTELMPLIEKTYSVKTGKDNTAITGFSMGGRESLNIGMKYPDKFGYVGAICPAPGASGAWKFASEEAAPYLIFITAGSDDTVVYTTPNGYHENFTNNNVPHIWHYVNGGYHGDNSIHAHLYNFIRAAFKA